MTYSKDLLPITTERLLLRLLEPEEADLLVTYLEENREHLEPWEPTRTEKYYTTDLCELEIKKNHAGFFQGNSLKLAFFFKELPEGPIVGVCNFTNIIRGVFLSCFLGYSIHHKYEGKGLMYEALEAAGDFVFEKLKLHRIQANYMPRNERSAKLLHRLGFQREGYAKDYLKIAGKWEDHILTAKIKDEG
jgi:ribosomal-protein-alanine N-acetyltransferase